MGANSQEYRKNLVDRLEEDHEKSYLGKKYDNLSKHIGPMGILGGTLAPAIGSMAGSGLHNLGESSLGDYATMGGSALGALAAPLIYRSTQKRSIEDIKAMNSRNIDIKTNKNISGIQSVDSMLNSGKSLRNTFTGAMAASYGYGAITGNALMDPTTMVLAGKATGALSNPGSLAYLAGSQMAGANYLGNVVGNEAPQQAALLGSGISGIGSLTKGIGFNDLGSGIENIGSGIGHMTGMGGSVLGMLTYMLASAGGNKLTKSIRNMAQEKDSKKYSYRISDIGRKASADISVEKYDTMKAVSPQINLLTITGKLSPFESLALGFYQSIDKHVLHLNAIYDILSEWRNNTNNKSEDVFATHNEISDLLNEHKDTQFTTLENYSSGVSDSYLERTGERLSDIFNNVTKTIQKRSTDISAVAEIGNFLKIFTGGLFGNTAVKNIKALYGLDEDSKTELALSNTALDLNLPSSMIQFAEMDIGQVMKISDDIEGKQLAVQAFSAGILQNILKLQLEQHTNSNYFNSLQKSLDEIEKESWLTSIIDKTENVVGNIPILNIIAGISSLNRGLKNRASLEADPEEIALSQYSYPYTDGNINSEDIQTDFISYQFPNLFLESLSLDEERNQLLKRLLKCQNCSTADINKKSFGTYDILTKQIVDDKKVQSSFKNHFSDESEKLIEEYKRLIENDPKNKKKYISKREDDLKLLKESIFEQYNQSMVLGNTKTSVAKTQDDQKKEKFNSKLLEAFEVIAEDHKKEIKPKSNLIDQIKDTPTKLTKHFEKRGAIKGLFDLGLSVVTSPFKLIGYSFETLLSFGKKHKIFGTKLMAAAALGYLAYSNKDALMDSAKWVKKTTSKALEYFSGADDSKEDKDDWEHFTKKQKMGHVLEALGLGLMSLPGPAKIAGALLLASGIGLSLNWGKIIGDIYEKSPFFGHLIEGLLDDKTKQQIEATKINKRIELENKEKLDNFSLTHNGYKAHTNTELIKNLELIKDDKEKEKISKLLSKLDTDHNGIIDQADTKRKKEYEEAYKALTDELTHYKKEILALRTENLAHAQGNIKEIQNLNNTFSIATQQLAMISNQLDYSKIKLSALITVDEDKLNLKGIK